MDKNSDLMHATTGPPIFNETIGIACHNKNHYDP